MLHCPAAMAQAVARSARCCSRASCKPGTVSPTGYNHYSMLKSVEEIFNLPLLGFAAQPGLASFGADVFTNSANRAGHRGMDDGGDKLVQ